MNVKIKETIKSLILVVLFFATILLLYLVLVKDNNVNLSTLIPFKSGEEVAVMDAKEFIVPKQVLYRSESGELIAAEDKAKLYNNLCLYLSEFSNQGTSNVAEITEESYEDAIKNNKSIEFEFAYSMPFTQFCNTYDINRTNGYSTIKKIDAIAISDASKESVLFKDSSEGKYYRIMSEAEEDWEEEVVGGEAPKGDSMYTTEEVLGVASNILIPVAAKRNTEEVYCMYETFIEGSFAFEDIAEEVFGETISFVRKIKDSFGNTTYMYGYGEKTLSLTADGKIEYKNTALDSGSSSGLFGDLQTAINFVTSFEGWHTQNSETELKLYDIESIGDDKNEAYVFYFNQCLSDENISGEDTFGMKISVEQGQVSSYSRNNVIAIKSYAEPEPVTEVANAISEIAAENNKTISETVKQIEDIDSCYKMEGNFLIPSWQITFKDGSIAWIGLKQKQF